MNVAALGPQDLIRDSQMGEAQFVSRLDASSKILSVNQDRDRENAMVNSRFARERSQASMHWRNTTK